MGEPLDCWPTLAGGRKSPCEALHSPFDVDEGAILFAMVGHWQGDVRRLGQGRVGPAEDDQELRLAQQRHRLGIPGGLAEVAVAHHQHRAPGCAIAVQQVVFPAEPRELGAAAVRSCLASRDGWPLMAWNRPFRSEIDGYRTTRRSGQIRQPGEEIRLFRGEKSRAEESDLTLACRAYNAAMNGVQRLAPAGIRPFSLYARGGKTRLLLVALEACAAVVAHPVVVDLDVEARLVALDVAPPLLHGDVATDLAAGADRRLLVEVPDALGEAEASRGEGAHRADVHDAGGERIVQLLAGEGADLHAGATVEEPELAGARDLLGEADAARALEAP